MIGPEHLNRALVESLLECAHPNGEGPDPNYGPDRVLVAAIREWLRWDKGGRKRSIHVAARTLCDRINARTDDAVAIVAQHESAAGGLCTSGSDGMCTVCGVELSLCSVCGGIGYHREGCSLSDDRNASGDEP